MLVIVILATLGIYAVIVLLALGRVMKAADERTGLLFVFRTFDRVAFAVVLNTTDPVRPGDFARTPSLMRAETGAPPAVLPPVLTPAIVEDALLRAAAR